MARDAAVTVRVPADLKRRIALRAKQSHRSVSAQIVHELEQAVASEHPGPARSRVPFVGRYEGARIPTDAEILEVRRMMWARLDPRRK